jgi:hypothetical protein
MSVYQTSGQGGRLSLRQEAAQRGTTVYKVRREREMAGTGAPVTRRIPWNKLPDEQRDAIREYVPRRFWREIVHRTIQNIEHYQGKPDKMTEFEYWYGYENFGLLDYLERIEALEKSDDDARKVFWYHGR